MVRETRQILQDFKILYKLIFNSNYGGNQISLSNAPGVLRALISFGTENAEQNFAVLKVVYTRACTVAKTIHSVDSKEYRALSEEYHEFIKNLGSKGVQRINIRKTRRPSGTTLQAKSTV